MDNSVETQKREEKEGIEKQIFPCSNCGGDQEYKESHPYCTNCGSFLDPNVKINKRRVKGENLRGGAILGFFGFLLLFLFASRFYGTIGMVASFLAFLYSYFVPEEKS